MASVTKTKNGYRVQVYVGGVRDSKTLRTKREADAWGAARETELSEAAAASPGERIALWEVLVRYSEEVSPTKRGVRWEQIRLAKFGRDEALPVKEKIANVTPEMIGAWVKLRIKCVGPGTVIRELGLLSSVFEHARREWRLVVTNPVGDVRRPRQPDHREVVISWSQIRVMLRALGHLTRGRITEVRQAVAIAFLLALRTGMRAGEICGLTWDRVHYDLCRLPITKTKARDVPLVYQSRRLIERMRGWDECFVIGVKKGSLDAMFRKYRDRAGLSGFTFHDSRHTAATRLAPHIDILDLCKMFGWKDPKQAMVYYNPTASEIAKRLSRSRG